MCIVCVEWNKGILTNEEAIKALEEVVFSNNNLPTNEQMEHTDDLMKSILSKEVERRKSLGEDEFDELEWLIKTLN